MAVPLFDYDTALLACARGDQHAFQDLYLHEAPHMLALSLKMLGERAGAEDLVRDAFILIWKNAESFDPQTSSARAWMHSILRYRALARLRQTGRIRPGLAVWSEALPALPTTAEAGSLTHTLATLEDAPRQAILMAFYQGCHYEQISERLKVSTPNIKARVQQGLSKFTEQRQA
ncbi:sigma-70 family RNA polymerase sigma factor [Pollutimonas harenae]|uniref:Sigma-70 family RNA polymerase sigma factor n=1 Tax=Pollutimonas harenae TaxID=657015 RepID=A0A853GUT6_9BURK|nr:sigma-70 family RNA polymerase sigma factor [Pollutimonas harenae]NYT85907.1 sigma-70 family RNA polymerase sigma factor [Pollutimonas harenae]TEA70960.1 sigma-70 family RNA polymerase sigma factor [Pollutimonas harenae]